MRPRKATSRHQPFRATSKRARPITGAVLVAALCGCAAPRPEATRAPVPALPNQTVRGWVTSADHSRELLRVDAPLEPASVAPEAIEIDPTRRYQTMVGFGASITDAAAGLIRQRMNGAQRAALMKDLFGPAPGLEIGFVRLTIGASDFSLTHYSLDDMPPGESDPGLVHFSIAPIRDTVVPVVQEALSLNPSLRVMASPWSAPGWMKSSGALVGGTLLPQFYEAFASYLVKYVDAMQDQGIPIFALTAQNEPRYEPATYPGMLLDPTARAQLIGRYLGPALAGRKPGTLIMEWDHNWLWPEEPLQVLGDRQAAAYISGVAWHCYLGKVTAQAEVHQAYPDKDAYMTECTGGDWEKPSDPALLSMTRELIIGSTRAWARGVLFWNLALDESSGPHLGGCRNCRGLVTIDSRTGEVRRNDEYYVIAHASRFVHPGAERIESSETDAGLANVAFRNEDDGSIVLIAANSAASPRALRVRCRDREFRYTMPERSVATFVWTQPGG
jgi:glucosylceramidase